MKLSDLRFEVGVDDAGNVCIVQRRRNGGTMVISVPPPQVDMLVRWLKHVRIEALAQRTDRRGHTAPPRVAPPLQPLMRRSHRAR